MILSYAGLCAAHASQRPAGPGVAHDLQRSPLSFGSDGSHDGQTYGPSRSQLTQRMGINNSNAEFAAPDTTSRIRFTQTPFSSRLRLTGFDCR